jgi:lysophospholipase L1-like esterase
MLLPAAKLALAPLLLLQGRRVRRLARRLPEAAGPREAVAGGEGDALRVLLVGDSATAGVGAAHQDEALAGRLAEALLAARPEGAARVHWRLVARSGASTAEALALLEADHAQARRPFRADLAVVAVGVNDVTSQRPLRRWLRDMEALAARLERVHGARLLVVSGLPPMHLFPLLPQPLRWYLGACARRYDRALRRWARQRPGTLFVPLPAMTDPAVMADDGFHPGPPAYRAWARALAEEVAAVGTAPPTAAADAASGTAQLRAAVDAAPASAASPPA